MGNGKGPVALTTMALGLAASLGPVQTSDAQAHDAPSVATRSAVYVERVNEANTRTLEPAVQFRRGERVITILTWERFDQSGTGRAGFVITNPLPPAITFQQSASDDQQVSVDGGRTWGALGRLAIGNRLATPEDVTHIRWRIDPATAAQGRGRIAYSGIVR